MFSQKWINGSLSPNTLIYGFCYGNSWAAVKYRRLFRTAESRRGSHQTLWERGTAVPRNQEHVARLSIVVEVRILDLVKRSPTISARRMSNRLSQTTSCVWPNMMHVLCLYYLLLTQVLQRDDYDLHVQFAREYLYTAKFLIPQWWSIFESEWN